MGYNNIKMLYILIYCAVTLAIAGCSVTRPAMPPIINIEGISENLHTGQIIHLETKKVITFDRLIDQLESRELIFIGEVHDNPDHHLIQVQILQALMDRHGPFTVAMELFQEQQQALIDSYLEGNSTEETFLKQVKWNSQWGFDYHFYRPLILLAKERGVRILAINAPTSIVRKVARHGLQSLKPAERARLAGNIDLNNEGHKAYLREAYKRHAHLGLQDFDYFYQAQCVWEDTMAENIAEYLKKNGGKMVVFSGNGHIIKKFGVPDRTLRRLPVRMATIVLQPLLNGRTDIKKGMADYIWLTGNY